MSSLVADLLNLGLRKDEAEMLLGARQWDLRIELAWKYLEPAERGLARSLDYDKYGNY